MIVLKINDKDASFSELSSIGDIHSLSLSSNKVLRPSILILLAFELVKNRSNLTLQDSILLGILKRFIEFKFQVKGTSNV